MKENQKRCHCCGKEIQNDAYLQIEKIWGYFSNGKDGERHQICLCEACYDQWIRSFKYPPDIQEVTELI